MYVVNKNCVQNFLDFNLISPVKYINKFVIKFYQKIAWSFKKFCLQLYQFIRSDYRGLIV